MTDGGDIIDALIERRREMGLTQKRLAEKARLAQSAVARFERKKVVPRCDLVFKIANALNCEIVVKKSDG